MLDVVHAHVPPYVFMAWCLIKHLLQQQLTPFEHLSSPRWFNHGCYFLPTYVTGNLMVCVSVALPYSRLATCQDTTCITGLILTDEFTNKT
jgi:uncharacterized membrane protein YhdT